MKTLPYGQRVRLALRSRTAAFAFGMLICGLVWIQFNAAYERQYAQDHPPVVTVKTNTVTKTTTKTVTPPQSLACQVYLQKVVQLREGQRTLSKVKGQYAIVVQDLRRNLMTQDFMVVKDLQHRMESLNNLMDSAWFKIGDASATLDEYLPGQDPCTTDYK